MVRGKWLKNFLDVKLEESSVKIIIGFFGVLLVLLGLSVTSWFGGFSLDIAKVILFVSAVVILMEIGIVSIIKARGKNLDFFQWIGLSSSSLILLMLGFGLFGFDPNVLVVLRPYVIVLQGVSFLVEAFVR